jgi:hypothetical protein
LESQLLDILVEANGKASILMHGTKTKGKGRWKNKLATIGEINEIKRICLQLYTLFLPSLFVTEGGFLMVALGVLFYIFHGKRYFQVLSLGIISIISAAANGFSDLFSNNYQWMMFFSAIPIILYNGEKGKGLKSFFYYFYPAHIIVFAIFSFLLRQ